jgi:hypothetical protein
MPVIPKFVSRESINIYDPVILRDFQEAAYIQVRLSRVDVTAFQDLLS